MVKISKNTFLLGLVFVLLTTILGLFCAPFKIGSVYAAAPPVSNNLVSQSDTMINNVILFAFSNHSGEIKTGNEYTQNTKDFVSNFDNYMNSDTNSSSLQYYYKAMSNGKFTIQSNLVMDDSGTPADTSDDKPFVAILAHDFNYYLTNGEQKLITDILTIVTASTSNTTLSMTGTDCNGDTLVDNLTFISMEFPSGVSDMYSYLFEYKGSILWPHVRTTGSSWSFTYKGKSYNCRKNTLLPSPFLTSDNGLYLNSAILHEMGHVLNLPDLYVPNSSGLCYVSCWDLMSNNFMQSINEYFKYKLGWLNDNNFKELTHEGTYTLKPANYNEIRYKNGLDMDDETPTAFYIQDDAYPNQYIVIEYKDLQNEQGYDHNLDGKCLTNPTTNEPMSENFASGLVIYRVNENYTNSNQIIASSTTDKPSIFFFRNGALSDPTLASLQVGESFGYAESEPTTSLNTDFISFATEENSLTTYVNSTLVVTVSALDENGITFKIRGGSLADNPAESSYVKDYITDSNLLEAICSTYFSDKDPNDLKLEHLSILENQQTMDLSNKGITDLSGLSVLNLRSIKTLYLNSNRITNGLEELSGLTTLQNLYMSNCGLTNIDFVENLNNLQNVDFSLNQIQNFKHLNPIRKTHLQFANIVLNNLDTDAPENKTDNAFLISNTENKFAVGLQCIPTEQQNLKPQKIKYYSKGMPINMTLNLTIDDFPMSLEDGETTLGNGSYKVLYDFDGTRIEINFEINVVTLRIPVIELLVGQQKDAFIAAETFDGWKPNYTLFKEIFFNGEIVPDADINNLDTSEAGVYTINFRVIITSNHFFDLTQYVIIYDNVAIAKGEGGIIDEELYTLLLKKVGKTAEQTLYSQDLYFYDISYDNDPITELDFSNSTTNLNNAIQSLEGIQLVNLKKIVTINLNRNKVHDISPLFVGGNEALPRLENLYLAANGISDLPEEIGEFYSLKKIDLSFNNLTRVDALRPIADFNELISDGKEQNLELVNLNMNNINFSATPVTIEGSSETIDYEEINGFIKSVEVAPEGYKNGDSIFIIMIQELGEASSFMNSVNFSYYETSANKFTKGTAIENRFNVKINNSQEYQKNWYHASVSSTFKTAGTYVVSISYNTINPLGLTTTQLNKLQRTFYLSIATLNTLKQINRDKPDGYYMLEDSWNSAENYYEILSTERIKSPTRDAETARREDLVISTTITNPEYSFSTNVYYEAGGIKYPINLSLDEYYIYNGDIVVIAEYKIGISFTKGDVKYTDYSATLIYKVKIVRNLELVIDDENLENKLRSVLNKGEEDKFHCYDTYKMTTLDLSNAGIETIMNERYYIDPLYYSKGITTYTYGFRSFMFNNLTYLNLQKNKLSTFTEDTLYCFKNLQYLNLSYNNLSDSRELKKIDTNSTLYILAFMNNFTMVDNDDPDSVKNNWLMTGRSNKIVVFSGLQGINTSEKYFVTYSEEIIGAIGSIAGFYFIDANFTLPNLYYNFTHIGANHDDFEEDATSHYNYYYYYVEPKQYNITLNFKYGAFDFNEQIVIKHIKAYAVNTTYIVDYDSTNSEETRQEVYFYDCLTYENCDKEDFEISSQIYQSGELIDNGGNPWDNIYINELTKFDQMITAVHIKTGRMKIYKKTIYVKDREKPTITMNENGQSIETVIKVPYKYYAAGRIDSDIQAYDNYDNQINIEITAEIRNSAGELVDGVSIPLNIPDTYTISYYATDTSGNVSETIIRRVKVVYNDFETIRLVKPNTLIYVGDAIFSCTVYRRDNTQDPNPTFYWYVDGKFICTTKMDEGLPNPDIIITSTVSLPIDTAGKHLIEVRINQNEDNDFELVSQMSETEFHVLLDKGVVSSLIYVVLGLIALVVIVSVTIHIRRKKRSENVAKYEYNIISKK